ncbi:MAG: hypothetical protein H6661_10215 [Ardenticatenaceae bacterium]|nr:hypothetical protein [Ardenticatenaceae bacterium]
MCQYCRDGQDLENQISALNRELFVVTEDGGSNGRATLSEIGRLTGELQRLEEDAFTDPAACELWRVHA